MRRSVLAVLLVVVGLAASCVVKAAGGTYVCTGGVVCRQDRPGHATCAPEPWVCELVQGGS